MRYNTNVTKVTHCFRNVFLSANSFSQFCVFYLVIIFIVFLFNQIHTPPFTPHLIHLYLLSCHSQGLTTTFARQVLERDGPNQLKPPKGTPEYVKFARQLAGGLQCLMWVAAVICFIAFGIEIGRGNLTGFDNVIYAIHVEFH